MTKNDLNLMFVLINVYFKFNKEILLSSAHFI